MIKHWTNRKGIFIDHNIALVHRIYEIAIVHVVFMLLEALRHCNPVVIIIIIITIYYYTIKYVGMKANEK